MSEFTSAPGRNPRGQGEGGPHTQAGPPAETALDPPSSRPARYPDTAPVSHITSTHRSGPQPAVASDGGSPVDAEPPFAITPTARGVPRPPGNFRELRGEASRIRSSRRGSDPGRAASAHTDHQLSSRLTSGAIRFPPIDDPLHPANTEPVPGVGGQERNPDSLEGSGSARSQNPPAATIPGETLGSLFRELMRIHQLSGPESVPQLDTRALRQFTTELCRLVLLFSAEVLPHPEGPLSQLGTAARGERRRSTHLAPSVLEGDAAGEASLVSPIHPALRLPERAPLLRQHSTFSVGSASLPVSHFATTTFVAHQLEESANTYERLNDYDLLYDIAYRRNVVVKCAKKPDGPPRAVKIINRRHNDWLVGGDWTESVKREIAIAKSLRHPNLVRVYEVIDDPNCDKVFMVMDLCQRGPIVELTRETFIDPSTGEQRCRTHCDIVPPPQLRKWIRQLAAAVRYLHRHGVIHRDIKPENILLDEQGNLKLSDFGVSVMGEGSPDAGGTLFCTPPELVGANPRERRVQRSADVWAVGVTMYCLMYGELPFDGETSLEMKEQILSKEVKLRPYFPDEAPRAREIVRGLLDRDVQRRVVNWERLPRDSFFGTSSQEVEREERELRSPNAPTPVDVEHAVTLRTQRFGEGDSMRLASVPPSRRPSLGVVPAASGREPLSGAAVAVPRSPGTLSISSDGPPHPELIQRLSSTNTQASSSSSGSKASGDGSNTSAATSGGSEGSGASFRQRMADRPQVSALPLPSPPEDTSLRQAGEEGHGGPSSGSEKGNQTTPPSSSAIVGSADPAVPRSNSDLDKPGGGSTAASPKSMSDSSHPMPESGLRSRAVSIPEGEIVSSSVSSVGGLIPNRPEALLSEQVTARSWRAQRRGSTEP